MAQPNRQSPQIDPIIPTSIAGTSQINKSDRKPLDKEPTVSFRKKCCTFIYNREENTVCGRTGLSWLYIIIYSIVYISFLFTYTCIFLYCSLWIIRHTVDFESTKPQLLTYSEHGVGLSATPLTESGQPLIWYRKGHKEDYQNYINALNSLLVGRRRKRDVESLGPCGEPPYGYGDKPCIIVRINKQLHWAGEPLELNSTIAKAAPLEVQNWLKKEKKLWLHCEGFHSHDKEHIGRISYYPELPGFDPKSFPSEIENDSPLIAMQISNFTLGVSLVVECKLWYVNGPSTMDFLLYVVPDDKTVSNRSNV